MAGAEPHTALTSAAERTELAPTNTSLAVDNRCLACASKLTLGKRFISPVDHDSTLEPKAVLTVAAAAADRQITVVAEPSVEILSLDEP